MRTDELFGFIKERHAIHLRRKAGAPKPWTADPILRQYKFCNVYRELDSVTVWIDEHWRQQGKDAWFAMCVARFINLPSTLEKIGYPAPFKYNKMLSVMNCIAARGEPLFGNAYYRPSFIAKQYKEAQSLAMVEQIFLPLWTYRERMRAAVASGTLKDVYDCLCTFHGFGPFMAAQVVADVRYCYDHLDQASDWWTFAAPGPGSKRGMARLLNFSQVGNKEFLAQLEVLRNSINVLVLKTPHTGLEPFHAQDMQGCLCEFDKYERARLGEGRPKQSYEGGI